MAEIKFKATKKISISCESYRQIEKSGDLQFDIANMSDDVISLYTKDNLRIIIDCNKKTGVFTLKFPGENFIKLE